MTEQFFKVVRKREDDAGEEFYSSAVVFPRDELYRTYQVGKQTLPPHPKLPLLAFKTLSDALKFRDNQNGGDNLVVFEISAKQHAQSYPFLGYGVGSVMEALTKLDSVRKSMQDWPPGTVFCDSVTLIKKIS